MRRHGNPCSVEARLKVESKIGNFAIFTTRTPPDVWYCSLHQVSRIKYKVRNGHGQNDYKICHMVRNSHGTKWSFLMVRNGYGHGTKWFLIWYEMDGTKWLWYEMTIIQFEHAQMHFILFSDLFQN